MKHVKRTPALRTLDRVGRTLKDEKLRLVASGLTIRTTETWYDYTGKDVLRNDTLRA